MIIGQFKCLNNFIKYGMNLQKLHLVIRAVQIFRLYHQNCLIFEKISAHDNRRSSKILLVIIGECQIFKSHQENRFIFAKTSARDNTGSPNFQVNSQYLPYFCQSSARDNRGSSNRFNKTALFLRKFQFVIKGEVQIFKSLQQNYFILRKFQLVITGPVQIFKTLYQNRFIFEKISARNNRGSSNFIITSAKLIYF